MRAESIKFVAGEASKHDIKLSECDKFSYSLATILAIDEAVVELLPSKCKVYITKNYAWYDHNLEYFD